MVDQTAIQCLWRERDRLRDHYQARVSNQSVNRGGIRFGDLSNYNHEPARRRYERHALVEVDIRLLTSF